jgi:hypothetical protein
LDYFRPNSPEDRYLDGVYSSYTYSLGGLLIKTVLLDTRYNKSPYSEGPGGDFLGENQWLWLTKELADRTPDVILLGSSIQVIVEDKIIEESWSRFPASRNRLLDLILSSPNENIFILSGDIHYAEYTECVCTTSGKKVQLHEFTSSGLSHTFTHRLNVEGYEIVKSSAAEIMFDAYQAILPHRYRRNKVNDHYKGLNAGLIDVLYDDGTGLYSLKFSIINYKGDDVMTKIIKLKDNRKNTFVNHTFVNDNDANQFDNCAPVRDLSFEWLFSYFAYSW